MRESHPEIMTGAPVIKGTRIPVRTLLRRLADGDSIDVIQEDYPYVKRVTLEQLENITKWEGPHPEGCLCTRCRVEGFGKTHV